MPKLTVLLNGIETGVLSRDDVVDKMEFVYAATAKRPLSISMPIELERFGHQHCEAFFGGLLPDGADARVALGRRLGINARNSFNLLRAIGYECAGAISIITPEHKLAGELEKGIRVPSDAELASHIRDLHKRPLFIDVDGIRISLAGTQDKAAVCMVDGKVALAHGLPTTHILKPDFPELEGVVFNEYLCMKVAKAVGLATPDVMLYAVEDLVVLLVARYDRRIENQTNIVRIHQEDFCQALVVPPSLKYQSDGGPTLKDCFDLLMKTTVPAIDRNNLMNMVLFNFLIENMDAHAKNFSLLHDKGIQLAPAYDVICTRAFENTSQKMAMKIGGHYKPDDIYPRHWERLCDEVGFSFTAFKGMAGTMANRIIIHMEKQKSLLLEQHGDKVPEVIEIVAQRIDKNCKRLLKQFP